MSDYEDVLAKLRARLSGLKQEQVEVETAVSALERIARRAANGEATAAAQAVEPPQVRVVGPHAFVGMTMPVAIAAYLKTVQQAQTIRQIMDGLVAGGVKATGKNMRGHVYNTLHRLSEGEGQFRREGDNRWGLREWSSAPGANQATLEGMTH